MSVRAMSLVWERSRAKGSNLMMLLAIADYAKDNGREAWPAPRTLAHKTRLSIRAAELILAGLVKAGEVEPRWDVRDRRLFLDVRCVCAWTEYQTEGPIPEREIFAQKVREDFSRRLVRAYQVYAQNGFAFAKKPAQLREKSRAHIRIDPSVDPSEIRRAGAPAPMRPVETVENPDESLPVITKVVHEIFDVLGPVSDEAELVESIKARCAGLRIPYDGRVVAKALDSARWQRAHRKAATA